MPAPVNSKPPLESFSVPEETKVSLDWAPLSAIDLSRFDQPNGKETLASEVKDAVTRWGFWVVTGTGISKEETERQLAIGNAFFKLPLEEKREVTCDFSVGNYFGYREPTRFIGKSDVKENMEMLNIPKYNATYAAAPRHDFVRMFEDEIAPFHRKIWDNVVRKLLILFAIILELPETYFVDRHHYDIASEDHLRYVCDAHLAIHEKLDLEDDGQMIYHPRTPEEDKKIGEQWIPGHTDFGSLTLLFSQRVAALQIRTPNDDWKWVKPIDNGIICNAADTLSFLTKGYIKSTIHRVVRPPADQAHLDRLGLFYFVRPGNNVPMVPAPSPVLLKEGYITEKDLVVPDEVVTGYEYVRARVKHVHRGPSLPVAEKDDKDVKFTVKNLAIQDLYK